MNNAMVSVFSPVIELHPDEVRRVTDVTYLGVVNGTLAALKRMLRAIVASSCRSAPRSRIEAARSRRRTAAPSTQSRDLPNHCAPSFSISEAVYGSRWSNSRR